uniref:Uncharacterized protein n=1 Tax=Lepeophtheirus salmonis TaxID=72036 RepID=A0A0K2TTI8_LEPSM
MRNFSRIIDLEDEFCWALKSDLQLLEQDSIVQWSCLIFFQQIVTFERGIRDNFSSAVFPV